MTDFTRRAGDVAICERCRKECAAGKGDREPTLGELMGVVAFGPREKPGLGTE